MPFIRTVPTIFAVTAAVFLLWPGQSVAESTGGVGEADAGIAGTTEYGA